MREQKAVSTSTSAFSVKRPLQESERNTEQPQDEREARRHSAHSEAALWGLKEEQRRDTDRQVRERTDFTQALRQ